MHTLYDYLPSQNAWKIRQMFTHMNIEYRTVEVSIFEGAARTEDFLKKNPFGAVPALELPDGRCLSESMAILQYLAEGTEYLPDDPFLRAKVSQWMSFEADYIQHTVGSLRYWMLTGQEARVAAEGAARRDVAMRALDGLERHFTDANFLAAGRYTIADINMFAYTQVAEDAGFHFSDYPAISGWLARVREQPGHLAQYYDYSIDPHARGAL